MCICNNGNGARLGVVSVHESYITLLTCLFFFFLDSLFFFFLLVPHALGFVVASSLNKYKYIYIYIGL